MMKPHCDTCDNVITDGFKKWVEIANHNGANKIWHISVGPDDPDFCKDCWIAVLSKNLNELHMPPVADDDIPF